MNKEQIDNKIKELNKELTILNQEKEVLTEQSQLKCPHLRVERSGGGMWHEYPDYGYYPEYFNCLDCGLHWNSESRETNNSTINDNPYETGVYFHVNMMRNNIVKDTYKE